MTVKIDQAFVNEFVSGAFGLPIAHENADYKPSAGAEYVSLRHFPNELLPADLATRNDTTGAFQFVIYWPIGEGAVPAKQKADEIFTAFPIGAVIEYAGQKVHVTGQHRPNAAPEDGWFKVRGLINYRADMAR